MYLDYLLFNYYSIFILYIICPSFSQLTSKQHQQNETKIIIMN